jgi:hypothetical protein
VEASGAIGMAARRGPTQPQAPAFYMEAVQIA